MSPSTRVHVLVRLFSWNGDVNKVHVRTTAVNEETVSYDTNSTHPKVTYACGERQRRLHWLSRSKWYSHIVCWLWKTFSGRRYEGKGRVVEGRNIYKMGRHIRAYSIEKPGAPGFLCRQGSFAGTRGFSLGLGEACIPAGYPLVPRPSRNTSSNCVELTCK